MPSTRRSEALASAALFGIALSLALAAGAKAELPGRRVAVAGTSLSYPYTVEIPSGWYIYQEGNPHSMLLLVPPGAKNGDPDIIGVVACKASLTNPDEVVANVKRTLKGVKTAVVKDIDGVSGILAEWDQGNSTVLGLMLPTSTGCVQFMGQSPSAQFAARRGQYERIIFSVRRAQEAEVTPTKTPPSAATAPPPAPTPSTSQVSTAPATPQPASAATPQAPDVNSSPSAAPARPERPKVVLDSAEPWGVALRGGVDSYREILHKEGGRTTPGSVRAEWGVTLESLQAEMGDLPRFTLIKSPAEKALSCLHEKDGTSTCFPNPGAPWYVNFGEDFQWAVNPFLTFALDGRFYRYWATFTTGAFDEIRSTLLTRLGRPSTDKASNVHNMMGATFAQETLIWQMRHTIVILEKRAASDLTKGTLSAVYLPIADTIPKAPEAKPPM
jgi:hypothetical protein